MNGTTIVVLFLLMIVLILSMSARGERFRAGLLAAVVLLLSAHPAMVQVHNMLLKLMQSFS